MQKIRFIFARSYYKPISLAIQLRTGCKWSHVGVISEDGTTVLESRGGFGSIETPLQDFIDRYSETCIRDMYCFNTEQSYWIYRAMLGRDYDYRAFWGIATGLGFDDVGADQCAEYAARGLGYFGPEFLGTLTPKYLWKISHATN